MGLFTPERIMPVFQSRAEAFDFMVTERISKGDDYAEAVERADKFADVIAKNKKLPLTPPRPKNGVEKIVGYIEQIATVKKNTPKCGSWLQVVLEV